MGKTSSSAVSVSYRTFILRLLLMWMGLVFIFWLITHHLPSQRSLTETSTYHIPSFIATMNEQMRHALQQLGEALFIVSLIVAFVNATSMKWFYVHLFFTIVFMAMYYISFAQVGVSLMAYLLLLFSFFYKSVSRFMAGFEFMLSMLIVLIVVYASEYFVQWYRFEHGAYFNIMVMPELNSATFHAKWAHAIMPWFYCLFFVGLVRLFTTKWNRILLFYFIFLLVVEFYTASFFDLGLTCMLFPFINWLQLYNRFILKNK